MTQLETLHGHLRRSAKAQYEHKQALQHTKEMCQNAWDAFVKEHHSSEVIITDGEIYDVYEALYNDIEKSVSAHLIPIALFERKRFFDNINEAFKKRHLPYYQSPSLLYVYSVQKISMILIRFYIHLKPIVSSHKHLISGSREIPFHYLRASAGFYSRSLVLQDITMRRYLKRFVTI